MTIRFKVHDVLQSTEPFSEYLMTRSGPDEPIQPLVVSYWYIVTEVNLEHMFVKVDSYFLSSDYNLFPDLIGRTLSMAHVVGRVVSPRSTLNHYTKGK